MKPSTETLERILRTLEGALRYRAPPITPRDFVVPPKRIGRIP